MQYKIDHDYHIHSQLSSCSRDPEQSTARILQYARENGLSRICLTDHFWDSDVPTPSAWYAPQNFAHIEQAKPLPQADGVEFLFGCESDIDKHFTLGISPARYDELDFMVIPTTHLHMKDFTISEADGAGEERRAALWVERLDALLSMSLPFEKVGVAHLACNLINKGERAALLRVLSLIPDSEMERLFARAKELGCGIELNQSDMSFADSEADQILRPFRIAKSCGCKFYLGSDAHHPSAFQRTREVFERAVSLLGLTEADKFHISRA